MPQEQDFLTLYQLSQETSAHCVMEHCLAGRGGFQLALKRGLQDWGTWPPQNRQGNTGGPVPVKKNLFWESEWAMGSLAWNSR